MYNTNTVLLGLIPVAFDAEGSWHVSVKSRLLGWALEKLVTDLFSIGDTVERLSGQRVTVKWTFTPVEDSLLGKLATLCAAGRTSP